MRVKKGWMNQVWLHGDRMICREWNRKIEGICRSVYQEEYSSVGRIIVGSTKMNECMYECGVVV